VSSDLTPKQVAQLAKVVKQELKPKMFEELLESVREGGAILRGQKKALRRFEVRASGIRAIRERTSLSQSEFARLIGVSVKTLQNWEQDRGCLGGAGVSPASCGANANIRRRKRLRHQSQSKGNTCWKLFA
jgi:putative transcriptional regulator